MWGSHPGGYEDVYILEYNAVQSTGSKPTSEEHIASIFRVEE
jgi:hypothetical protein